MAKYRAIFFGISTLITSTHWALADPSGTINKFMNEPVSLFSYGIDKLNTKMENFATSSLYRVDGTVGAYNSGGATFDWDRNKITLFITRFTKDNEEPEKLEDECKYSINTLRTLGNVDPSKGSPYGTVKRSNYAWDFFPSGYALKTLTDDDANNLDSLITLQVKILNLKTFKQLVCSAPLFGTGYSVEK